MGFVKTVFVGALVGAVGFGCTEKSVTPQMEQAAANSGSVAIPHAQLGDNVRPTHYALDMTIDPRKDTFSGTVTIDVNIENPTQKIWLHGQTITATGAVAKLADGSQISMDYVELAKDVAPSGIGYLNLSAPIGPGAVTLVIPYETPFNTKLNSAYKAVRGDDSYVLTQFEAIGARQAFPGFDEPRFKVPFDVSITAPKDDFVYANTPITQISTLDDGMVKTQFATTRPLPTYLIAFGVGPWDVAEYADIPPTEYRDRPIVLRGIAARGEGKNMTYALKNTAGILEAMEDYFGSQYPYEKLDIIAAPEYAFGAMENPGAIVYTEYLLLMDEKSSLRQRRAYASVHAHELAHQWFGNLVTPVWWEDIWLNEAFATWMGNKAVTSWAPQYEYGAQTLKGALGVMGTDSLASTRSIREPLLRSENVMDQFDGITYRKGGGVLSMFESYLGEDVFRDGVRLHMKRYADGVASADDFFQSLADGSGNAKVVAALKSFVDQPGIPMIGAKLNCGTDGTNVHKLELSQSRYAPHGSSIKQGQRWNIPVCVAYDADGQRQKTCTMLEDKQTTLSLKSQACPSWLTLNADGAGYYRFSLDDGGWAGLLGNLRALNKGELLTVLDSFEAAFVANKMAADTYLSGLAAFAASKEYDVALKAGNALGRMNSGLVDESAHDALAKFTQELYAERYISIKNAKTMEARLMAPTLASRLVNVGGDAKLAGELATSGARYLGLDGDADRTALAPNMLSLGLSEAFKARGEAAIPALMALIKSGTPAQKGSAVGALASAQTTEMAARLLAEVLANTDAFTNRQASGLVSRLIRNTKTRSVSWAWFTENFDVFVETRIADVRRGRMPFYGGAFCDAQKQKAVESFFKSKAEFMPGYERSLAQILESIQLCAALKTAKSSELTAALTARYAD
ncbi:MAG: hypothetical protein COA91_09875 [Robiginitomaculum sp.]|nr:MAG: hypothetical protein COA91_09875 [Robiginitomaculum sp.]